MSRPAPQRAGMYAAGPYVAGALLMGITLASWVLVVRDASAMVMPSSQPSLAEAAGYVSQWGVMMSAMMLPSATPMLLMYRTVSSRLAVGGERVVRPWMFAAVYLLAWLLPGIPLYLLHVAFIAGRTRWPSLDAATPYLVATVLAAAAAYQFTGAKRACLRQCESPMAFLMRRWKNGYGATLRLAVSHAAYCIGCCWGLMAILVVAGAMSLPWVLGIALVVLAEKLLPNGQRTSRVIGAALFVLAAAVAARPDIAGRLSGMPSSPAGMEDMHMDMPMDVTPPRNPTDAH